MRVNTVESIELGQKIHDRFGSWEAARAAAQVRDDGAYVVPANDSADEHDRRTPAE